MKTEKEIEAIVRKGFNPSPEVIEVSYNEDDGQYDVYIKFEKTDKDVIYAIYGDEDGDYICEANITPKILKNLNRHANNNTPKINELLEKYTKQIESVKNELDEIKNPEYGKAFLDGQYYILSEIIKDLKEV